MTRRITRWCFCLLGLFGSLSAAPAVAAERSADRPATAADSTDKLPRHTLIYGGDLFCARRLNFAMFSQTDAERKRVLAEIAPLLRRADVAMINLEGMVTTGGYYYRIGRCSYNYRAAPRVIDLLTDAGVDLVTIGNNHNGDYGPEAQVETIDHLSAAGIGYAGAGVDWADAVRPVYRQVGDVVIAIVGMETADAKNYAAEKDRPGVHFVYRAFKNPKRDQEMVDHLGKIVREARRHAHLVIFSPHGGNRSEDLRVPYVTPPMRAWAAKLIREAGFDAILGHGAHHHEGVEIIDGKPVIYDAGNLVLDFDPVKKPHLDWQSGGMLWQVEFSKAGIHRLEGIPLRMAFLQTKLAAGTKRDEVIGHVVKYSKEFGTALEVRDGNIHISADPGGVIEPTEEPKAIERPRHEGIRRAPNDVLHERLPEGATPLEVCYPGGIRLVGYEIPAPTLLRGQQISAVIVLYWQTDRPIKENYVVHLDARPVFGGKVREDVVIREEPHLPGDWIFPTYMWPVGKVVQDTQNLRMDFRGKPVSDGMAFFVGLRKYDPQAGHESTFVTPVEARGVELLHGNLVPLGSRPIAEDAPWPRAIYRKWREGRKVELSSPQPFGAPPLIWPPQFGGDQAVKHGDDGP
jgi:hypothetical protein